MKRKLNENRKPNQLEGQNSPYLLQHLYNPVNWHPWGELALSKAVNEDKPILISIGYSACHWCHVMEHESFEDNEVADIMNREFICIKVDREERPDIDHMYMTAVQLLTRQGGWPLNCFALPDTKPFWGGTYFPKDQWKNILLQIAQIYKNRKQELIEQADHLTEGIASSGFISPAAESPKFDIGLGEKIFKNIMKGMDKKEGGTLRAPKFPLPVNQEFLLLYYYFSGDKIALDQLELSLEKMAAGGIYDQLGGGFARYSTDEYWKVPHFEKMLYDNGQLVSLYSNAFKILKNPVFRDVVYQTIEFISRELSSPYGTFYSALDADSEGEEGKFYVWKESEIDEILGDDSPLFKSLYCVGKEGYWENENNILIRKLEVEQFARQNRINIEKFKAILDQSRNKLFNARSKRERPGLDNKVLISWNALMIKGLADAYAAFGENSFLEMAKKATDHILLYSFDKSGGLYRCLNGREPYISGFLEDYSLLIMALIRMYEVSMMNEYLLKAKSLTEYVLINFTKKNSSFFSYSHKGSSELKADFYESADNVIPSSNSVMALNLFYLANYFEKPEWYARANQMLMDIKQHLSEHSLSFSNWGRLLLLNTNAFYTLVVCGSQADEHLKEINSSFLAGLQIAASASENDSIPIFESRYKKDKTLFYLCSLGTCMEPTEDLQTALGMISYPPSFTSKPP
jgi:uncharacterized protein